VRLFAAVDPSPEALTDLEHALVPAAARSLRWMPPEQWHITLAFYGEVDPRSVDDLCTRLDRAAARTTPPSLTLTGAGTFPRRPDAARVLWAGVHGDTELLARLADRARAAGRRVGAAVEHRRFVPHLTLARAPRPANMRRPLTALWSYAGPTWTADSLRLVRSTIGASVHHETLARFDFAEPGQ